MATSGRSPSSDGEVRTGRSDGRGVRAAGKSVSHLHLKYLNPFQNNLGEILYNFKQVLVPELNLGQFENPEEQVFVPAISLNKIQRLPR